MDHAGWHDDAPLDDDLVARPDTVGVGWPTTSPGDGRTARALWGVLLVVGAVVWIPISLLLTLAGTVAVAGWGDDDGSRTPGLIDEVSIDTVFGLLFVVVLATLAAVLLGWMSRAATGCSNRRAVAAGVVLAVWAPAAAILTVVVLVVFD